MEILVAVSELPAKQHYQSSPFTSKLGQIGQISWYSKTAPRIFIFSVVLGAKYFFYVKSIAIVALTFFWYIVSVLASVC